MLSCLSSQSPHVPNGCDEIMQVAWLSIFFCGLQALIDTAMSEIDCDGLKDGQLTNGSLDGRL